MTHHKQLQLKIFCSSPKPEIKPDLNFVPAERKIHMDFISPYLGLLDLPNKNTASPVKFEFQIHNGYTFSIWPMKYWGHTDICLYFSIQYFTWQCLFYVLPKVPSFFATAGLW